MGSIKSGFQQKETWCFFLLEALSVFYDPFAIQFFDKENSVSEDRFLMLGFSDEARLLIVCHCEREHGNVIRVISARKATKNEAKYYQGVIT